MDPVGSLAEPISVLRDTLADCPTWQQRLDVLTAEEAKEKIHYGPLFNNDGVDRPLAVLWFAVAGGQQVADGVWIELQRSGGILLLMEINAEHEDDPEKSYIDALNFFGGVMDDLAERAGLGDGFPMMQYEMVAPPDRAKRTLRDHEHNDWWLAIFRVNMEG